MTQKIFERFQQRVARLLAQAPGPGNDLRDELRVFQGGKIYKPGTIRKAVNALEDPSALRWGMMQTAPFRK